MARANLLHNQVASDRFSIVQGHLADAIRRPFDCVSANILTPIILTLITDSPRFCQPGGILICSGILEHQQTTVQKALEAAGYTLLSLAQQEGWVATAARYRKADA